MLTRITRCWYDRYDSWGTRPKEMMMMVRRLEPKGNWKYRWEAPSSSSDAVYVVAMSEAGHWACGCRGWTMHVPRRDCRHILAVKEMEPLDTVAMEAVKSVMTSVAAQRKAVGGGTVVASVRSATLSAAQVAAIEASLKDISTNFEPFLVRQTRRAITLE